MLFNPSDYGIDRSAHYAEHKVPGLKTPLLQFVRGQAQTARIALFLDQTNKRENVETALGEIRKFVIIDQELHHPPVCCFVWGQVRFQGVVASIKEELQLFDEDGNVLRARLTLEIKSHKSAEVQLRELNRLSPDRTRVRVVRDGETLAQLAHEAYGDPRLWRVIARANSIDRPRFPEVGRALRIPAL